MATSAALILAAGKGTRMRSERPKVLQSLLAEPMLAYVLEALRPLFAADDGSDAIWAVVGHRSDLVEAAFPRLRTIRQERQLGTGHALAEALPTLRESGCTHVLVVNGDVPLLSTETVRRFLAEARGAAIAFASLSLDDAGAYGRVVRADGEVAAIVEARDFDPARHGPDTGEVNAGLYFLEVEAVSRLLPRLGNDNNSGEYYITDLVALGLADGLTVRGINCGADESLLGVNSPVELARMEELLRARTAARLLENGVILHAPELVRVGPFAVVEPGAELTGPCEIYGRSRVESAAVIASHCILMDSVVHGHAQIRPFSHLERAEVGRGALVGPFARLRPGAVLEPEAHVGNFVELKNARLGQGAKANHLSYLGDAEIGPAANIGAGTITCNYDGVRKHRTGIGARAFIGSNTALVAPVEVGDGALVGAGSVITRNGPAGEMGIARGRQKILPRRG
ncbi:bifunctional UDP-N-acetylglucosamine diphosphorylase/glucosamine-1-phosphate N-acetyltransferase GlmU [uncultured Desulfovibrio sp.]|uniref:bifunctional UDP-N-acetylglucosamine diphosphorylase/glucosamine-1-phosphate N-acetyltransferase GlmU n=2 Tax=uncultured Desulfovibrio sp. TaxID=167968 RepID=UPI00263B6BCD|nr:bifunctional UDP-N-acetylglucosamine diphosphorylase/glucosamine-1-phosphate N-acetyltransferase GlmU [uncultured Desulfovibrio sp.]